ncbi:phosphoglycerate mutase [Chlorella sorokiniana]|uniref:Phosphoglycerate mutase n=1 Tax=Chlorella sorokiniana TaxID=3076 RepID=A0A2P6U1Z8_CHLSO|nr:phosphoglycerate mutase [Chlorella sorokiniana]|eukprot:PRW60329.1 phosphoglycerate mutase [Chlorella sorokiniana]
MEWVQRQWSASPTRFWSTGLQDYLRNVAKIRREFADVLSDDDNSSARASGQLTPGGTPGTATPPLMSAEKPAKYEPQLSLTPYCNTKVIHFIRHGEGFHNVGFANNLDACLTERGWDQAQALGRHMYSQEPTSGVQLVVVSPLIRALETAAGVFGLDAAEATEAHLAQQAQQAEQQQQQVAAQQQGQQGEQQAGGNGTQGGGGPTSNGGEAESMDTDPPPLLMRAQDKERNVQAAHGAVVPRPSIKFVAVELCRERLGPSQCDKRQALDDTRQRFPGVDFSLIGSDEDTSWEAGHVESESSVVVRGFEFLNWLMQRPETNIAVVTHSAFLWFTLTCFGNEFAKPVRENLQRWYENCEMRTVVLSDGGGAGVPDRTWFRGGEAYAEPQKGMLPDVKHKGKGSLLQALQLAWSGGGKSNS